MARPNQEAINTYMNITGVSEPDAIRKLEEHGGNLNEAVNAHFSEGDRNITHETSVPAPQDDVMDIDDPIPIASRRPPFSLISSAGNVDPFSLVDPLVRRSIFDSGTDFPSSARAPFVSHPREVREIPIEVKDGNGQSGHSGLAPPIDDVTETAVSHGPGTHGTVITDDKDDKDIPTACSAEPTSSHDTHPRPSSPGIADLPDYGNDIEEEMIRAAIEASKRDTEIVYPDQQFGVQYVCQDPSGPMLQQRQSHLEDAELAHAVSLSLETAEQEKALRELGGTEASDMETYKSDNMEELGQLASPNGRPPKLEMGSSSVQDEAEDVEEQPLVRNRSRQMSSVSIDTAKEIEEIEVSPPSRPQQGVIVSNPQHNESHLQSDEWGGISSEEHDEAVMLEAALFGGIPEGSGYPLPYAPHQVMQNGFDRTVGPNSWWTPRPPSPSLAAQRLIREQQDDEYLASLQADREKELKAREEAEARRLDEQAAREAALQEDMRKEDESRIRLEEEQ
ncbi:unnamed protein product, partial [Ilex paraguariensis]